jgi:hypothetical protein
LLAVYTSWQVGWQESAYLTSTILLQWGKDIQTIMYRIIKRIVRTVTTVTLFVRWEKGSPGQESLVEEITLPASYSLTEEDVPDKISKPKKAHQSSNPNKNEGENS